MLLYHFVHHYDYYEEYLVVVVVVVSSLIMTCVNCSPGNDLDQLYGTLRRCNRKFFKSQNGAVTSERRRWRPAENYGEMEVDRFARGNIGSNHRMQKNVSEENHDGKEKGRKKARKVCQVFSRKQRRRMLWKIKRKKKHLITRHPSRKCWRSKACQWFQAWPFSLAGQWLLQIHFYREILVKMYLLQTGSIEKSAPQLAYRPDNRLDNRKKIRQERWHW